MATLNNSINFIPAAYSSITMASAIIAPVSIGSTASTSLTSNPMNSYLQKLVRNTSPTASETLLFNVSMGLSGLLVSGGNVQCWVETDQITGISPIINAQYYVGDVPSGITPINFTMNIPIAISQIANASNTVFSIVIKNNTGVTLTLSSMSNYIPITYLYEGFQVA